MNIISNSIFFCAVISPNFVQSARRLVLVLRYIVSILITDLKMSPQLADECGMTTLERKKRRAPKPPATPVVTTDSTNQVELNDDQKKLETSASKSSMKRKAPTPPTDKAPPPPSDKAPPRFVPPPPPMEPPPEDKFASPVGPLSPKSMGRKCLFFTLSLNLNLFIAYTVCKNLIRHILKPKRDFLLKFID